MDETRKVLWVNILTIGAQDIVRTLPVVEIWIYEMDTAGYIHRTLHLINHWGCRSTSLRTANTDTDVLLSRAIVHQLSIHVETFPAFNMNIPGKGAQYSTNSHERALASALTV